LKLMNDNKFIKKSSAMFDLNLFSIKCKNAKKKSYLDASCSP